MVYNGAMRPPRPPTARLPRSDLRFIPGLALSALVHAVILILIIVVAASTAQVFTSLGGPGPAGGGGGGGSGIVRYVELPAAASAAPAVARPEQEYIELALPKPTLALSDESQLWRPPALRQPALQAVQLGRGAGTGGGPGAGSGTGGGVGSGQGTGVGAGQGPGSGDGSGVIPPEPRFITLPPDRPKELRGKAFDVHFWVNERGEITRVEVDPQIEHAEYRARFMEQVRQFEFRPARTLDGTPVAGHAVVQITL